MQVEHLQPMTARLGFKPKYVPCIAGTLAESLLANIDNVAAELSAAAHLNPVK
jgi:hypothetical protein